VVRLWRNKADDDIDYAGVARLVLIDLNLCTYLYTDVEQRNKPQEAEFAFSGGCLVVPVERKCDSLTVLPPFYSLSIRQFSLDL
jgi:hypothetical protein